MGETTAANQTYRQAALVLGLLSSDATGWKLTQAGQALADAPGELARRKLAERILAHPLVAMARRRAGRARRSETRAALVADLLSACTCLSASTAHRRAETLLRWLRWAETQTGNTEPAETTLWQNAEAEADFGYQNGQWACC